MEKYPLEKRTLDFAKNIILLCRDFQQDPINKPIINQLIRSGTSIGANYCEANNACSKKDFINKIFLCKKESQETLYWLKIFNATNTKGSKQVSILLRECQELVLIFQKIVSTSRANTEN